MAASTELNIILRDAAKTPLLRMTPRSAKTCFSFQSGHDEK
jgi:hypothetical protein